MRQFFQLGLQVIRFQLAALKAARGRHKLLEMWRFGMVLLPCVAFAFAALGGISRGLAADEELLPLMLIIPLMLFGLATVVPLLGLMLATLTSRPVAWLVGARRDPDEPRTF